MSVHEAWVREALRLHRIALDDAAVARAVEQFDRLAAIAAPLLDAPLDDHDEPANVFKP